MRSITGDNDNNNDNDHHNNLAGKCGYHRVDNGISMCQRGCWKTEIVRYYGI